ncbi:hypothetical protein JTB14_030720 [Gonioctena quinquepunctata]|nr:hypothetical protein JTB14_030720 [Gonioctena quinquepunctata]
MEHLKQRLNILINCTSMKETIDILKNKLKKSEEKELRTKTNRVSISTQNNTKTSNTSKNPADPKLIGDPSSQTIDPISNDAMMSAENKTLIVGDENKISCVRYVVKKKVKKTKTHEPPIVTGS